MFIAKQSKLDDYARMSECDLNQRLAELIDKVFGLEFDHYEVAKESTRVAVMRLVTDSLHRLEPTAETLESRVRINGKEYINLELPDRANRYFLTRLLELAPTDNYPKSGPALMVALMALVNTQEIIEQTLLKVRHQTCRGDYVSRRESESCA
ncbi:hypothetical protein DBZ36_13065 [Alginatibacterium sediminis]|uniref:Uncharacterized protein n=1 Tax=Alginatibacterium sediminis TaxID=2164068 RepID=A0A420E9N8_9ALTE|nr:hypothetical protein [Alginatibacterium sediminis]RKF17385.1 hypothetical protein DBZ36_13065 [Alginatibacterium sediminis]